MAQGQSHGDLRIGRAQHESTQHESTAHKSTQASRAVAQDPRRAATTVVGAPLPGLLHSAPPNGPGVLVGRADDPCEREAEVVARRVVRMLRRGAPKDSLAETGVAPVAVAPPIELARRRPAGAADPLGGTTVGGGVLEALQRSPQGQPLRQPVRAGMEAAFGTGLGHVRVHAGSEADALARAVQAVAFTRGSDIYFSSGSYAPTTPRGQHLLAHELTHVVQSAGGLARSTSGSATDEPVRRWPDWMKSAGTKEKEKKAREEQVQISSTRDDLQQARAQLAALRQARPDGAGRVLGRTAAQHGAVLARWEQAEGAAAQKLNDIVRSRHDATSRIRSYAVPAAPPKGTPGSVNGELDAETGVFAGGAGSEWAGTRAGVEANLVDIAGGSNTLTRPGQAVLVDGTQKLDDKGKPLFEDDDTSRKDAHEATQDKATQVAAGFGLALSPFVFAVALQDLFETKERDGWETFDRGFGVVSATAGLGGNIASLTSTLLTGDTEKGAKRDATLAAASLGFVDFFADVRSTAKEMSDLYDVLKDADAATGEAARQGFVTAAQIGRLAQATIERIRSMLSALDKTPTGSVIAAVPGLGIAIGCAEVIVKSFDLWESIEHARYTRQRKEDAGRLAGMLREGDEGSEEARLIRENASATDERREAAADYLHFAALEYVQDKNSRRAILNISTLLAGIAGDAAVLGGASAPVGMGLKLLASCTKHGASIVRNVKQFARDQVQKSLDRDNDRALQEAQRTGGQAAEDVERERQTREAPTSRFGMDLTKTSSKKAMIYSDIAKRAIKELAGAGPPADHASEVVWVHAVRGFEATGTKVKRASEILRDQELDLHVEMIKSLQKRE